MKKFLYILVLCFLTALAACDLQPKIASIPDSIGMFIEDRYPALLADPETQPEIYNSAASDYGVYASPELYGSSNVNDYVLYADVDDYVLKPDVAKENTIKNDDYIVVPLYGGNFIEEKETNEKDFVIVVKGDTLYSIAQKNKKNVAELAKINNLKEPYNLSIGQKILLSSVVKENVPNVISTQKIEQKQISAHTTKVNLKEITVEKGDTLYSLSRKYEIPVNDLAVMNKISAPFALSVGQKLKVPQLDNKVVVNDIKIEKKITPAKLSVQNKNVIATNQKNTEIKTTNNQPKTKISSDPKKQLPKISPRSSARFSWPVRGKILSQYGAKSNGLFNDGINISAPIGTAVKSAENGVVAYAGNEVKGMGNLIIIQHSDGWMTVYAHLDSMNVKRGTKVGVGQQIGKIGQTGKVDKPQLHFEIRKGTKAYNPINYLKKVN